MNEHARTRVLVAYASKMGGTEEIVWAISHELRMVGYQVALTPAKEVEDLTGYDALVLGSAVYTGRWRRSAVRLLHRAADAVEAGEPLRVWVFQSGPLTHEPSELDTAAPKRVAEQAVRAGAGQVVTFGGRLDVDNARGFLASRMAHGDHAGDFRHMDDVAAWGRQIGTDLTTVPAAG